MKVLVSRIYKDSDLGQKDLNGKEFRNRNELSGNHFVVRPNQRFFVTDREYSMGQSFKYINVGRRSISHRILLPLDAFDVFDDLDSCKNFQLNFFLKLKDVADSLDMIEFIVEDGYPTYWEGSYTVPEYENYVRRVNQETLSIFDGFDKQEKSLRSMQMLEFLYVYSKEERKPTILWFANEIKRFEKDIYCDIRNFPPKIVPHIKENIEDDESLSEEGLVEVLNMLLAGKGKL